jgi:hypothetical protein
MSKTTRTALWLTVVLVAACLVRLPLVLADDFPVNDGGVFLAMATDLASARLAVPDFTSYNRAHIPFAYPPLGIFLTAAVHLATGWPVLELLRFLPLLANFGTAVVFFFLARRLLPGDAQAGAAAIAFVLLPRSYAWLIMGGGITRSFGFLFACASIVLTLRVLQERRRAAVVPAALCLGAAVLSHPEMGVWAPASIALLLAFGLDRWRIARVIEIAAGAAAVAAPWWLFVASRHGLAPFRAASAVSGWSARSLLGMLSFDVSGEPHLTPLACLALIGAAVAIARRELLLPVWAVAAFVVVPRGAPTPFTVPLAILIAIGLTGVVLPVIGARDRIAVADRPEPAWPPSGFMAPARSWRGAVQILVIAALVAYTVVASNLRRGPDDSAACRRVPAAERQAMAWVEANTPAQSTFAVVSSDAFWWTDPVNEWFPVLTGRASVAVPNGVEWVSGAEFDRRVRAHDALRLCPVVDAGCLAAFAARFHVAFTHVYVSKLAAKRIDGIVPVAALGADSAFVAVYDGPGATVFARR